MSNHSEIPESCETPTPKPWTVTDCFAGPDCWCGIVVNPDGEECNPYGEMPREVARYIVDALNKKPGAEHNTVERFPTPWFVQESQHGWTYMVTEDGVGKDDLDTYVGACFGKHNQMFVDAVNGFYGTTR